MFGFSFSELVVVVVVTLLVMGPKDLPKMLRKLGQYAGKLRRMASDLRAQSGIDEALRSEGLADDIAEIRKLARGELDSVQRSVSMNDPAPYVAPASYASPPIVDYRGGDFYVIRDREYPREGADCHGALPDNAFVYQEGLAKSKFARDPLYVLGDSDGILPPEEIPEAPSANGASHVESDVPAEASAEPTVDVPAEPAEPARVETSPEPAHSREGAS